jgi:RNA polymerase sigma factor (sigma-70 family)
MKDLADERSGDLMLRWRAGDQRAATELFHRYASRLILFVRRRLPSRLGRRLDPEDVVQSAYRCFFGGSRDGRYVSQRGGDLWQLLVTITLHKLQMHVKRNRRQKRTVDREQNPHGQDGLHGLPIDVLAQQPSPIEAAALADEVEQLMRGLEPRNRRILEMRLQGYNLEEIAAATECGLRTVCRVLEQVKGQLKQWQPESLEDPDCPGGPRNVPIA